jgi:nucleotide-binding universal stress UspA family protein
MLSIDTILWPTDFSRGAERAFPHAAALAQSHGAALHILNVREGREAVRSEMADQFPVSTGTLANYLDAADAPSRPVDLDALPLVQEQVDAPSPAAAIVRYLETNDIDLAVVGTHGRRGLQRLFVGSVTEEVVRQAPCPVLTVRATADRAAAWTADHILVPVDFSEGADQAVRYARELARLHEAQVTLLHAVEEVMYPSAYGMEMADVPGPKVLERVDASLAALARDEMGDERVEVESIIGYAPSVILDYQDKHDVDLTVIATHGRSGLERLLLGSVTERVVRRSPAPVFVVKPFGKSLLPGADAESADGPPPAP